MKQLVKVICLLVGTLAGIAYAGGLSETVNVKLAWTYKEIPPAMRIYEISNRQTLPLWTTETVTNKNQAPITTEIPDSTLILKKGEKKRFALVYTNTSSNPVYFFAAPHSVEPAENALGFKFKCLCINHAYKISPGETWYRIVEFRIAKEFLGDHITLTHALIGMDASRAERFNKSMANDTHDHDHM